MDIPHPLQEQPLEIMATKLCATKKVATLNLTYKLP
jgi:hypothetical protein